MSMRTFTLVGTPADTTSESYNHDALGTSFGTSGNGRAHFEMISCGSRHARRDAQDERREGLERAGCPRRPPVWIVVLLGACQVGNAARRLGHVNGLVLLVDFMRAVNADRDDRHVAPPCAVSSPQSPGRQDSAPPVPGGSYLRIAPRSWSGWKLGDTTPARGQSALTGKIEYSIRVRGDCYERRSDRPGPGVDVKQPDIAVPGLRRVDAVVGQGQQSLSPDGRRLPGM